jgi:hypothetical protein
VCPQIQARGSGAAAPGRGRPYDRPMTVRRPAAEDAAARVASVRDDPVRRLQLAATSWECGLAGRRFHKRFARSELAFLRSQIRRGVLAGLDGPSPGSPWWRAVNERLLRDTTEAMLLADGAPGRPSATSVELWLEFAREPSAASWYRAHNASVVAGYLEHAPLAGRELLVERFFLNVALVRVLYAHALSAAPRLALGRLAPLGRLLGDPRGGTVDMFLSVKRVFPERYPLTGLALEEVLAAEHRVFRALDYGVIGSRIQALYDFAARSLGEPRVAQLLRDGVPAYVWPAAERDAWLDGGTKAVPRLLAWATGARRAGARLH